MNNKNIETLLKKVVWAIVSVIITLAVFLVVLLILKYVFEIPLPIEVFFWLIFWIAALLVFRFYIERKKQIYVIDRAHFRFFIIHILILTAIVYYLGGIESFVPLLYSTIIIYSVFLLSEKRSFIITFLSILSFSTLVALEYFNIIPHIAPFGDTGVYKDPYHIFSRVLTISVIFILSVLVANRYSRIIKEQSKDILKVQAELKKTNKELKEKVKELESVRVNLEEAKETLEVRVAARVKELEELTQSLEEKVKKRTKEIQKKVQELEKFQKFTVGREIKMIELKKKIKKIKNNNNNK